MKCPFSQWALKRLGIIPVFFLLHTFECTAQNYLSGPRSLGIGACYTTLFCPNSTAQNPALLPMQSQTEIYIAHSQPFITKELGISSLNVTSKVSNGTFSFLFENYGIKGFQHFSSTLSYALKLHEKIMAGISFYYANELSNREWNYLWCVGISAGFFYHVNDKTNIGIHLGNPVRINNYPEYGNPYTSILSIGFSRLIYDKTTLYSELSYFSDIQYQFKFGLEYTYKKLIFQCGYHSKPQSFSFGTTVHNKKVNLHFAYAWSSLGFSYPGFQLSYFPKQ